MKHFTPIGIAILKRKTTESNKRWQECAEIGALVRWWRAVNRSPCCGSQSGSPSRSYAQKRAMTQQLHFQVNAPKN